MLIIWPTVWLELPFLFPILFEFLITAVEVWFYLLTLHYNSLKLLPFTSFSFPQSAYSRSLCTHLTSLILFYLLHHSLIIVKFEGAKEPLLSSMQYSEEMVDWKHSFVNYFYSINCKLCLPLYFGIPFQSRILSYLEDLTPVHLEI